MAKDKGKKDGINIEDINIEDEAPAAKKGKKTPKQEVAPKDKGGKTNKGKTAKPEKGKQPEHLKREPLGPEYVTAEQLAEEFGKKGRDVRQVLRDNEIDKPESGRWVWHVKKDAAVLKQIRSLLNGAAKKSAEPAKEGKKGKDATPAPEEKKRKKNK